MPHLTRLYRYRGLLWNLALGELKARHRQTALGMAWALMQPLSMMAVFAVVFSVFARVSVEGTSYVLFAYTGLVSWLFFANSLSAGLPSVVSNMNLVTKASFPREVIPLSKLVATG
ncbi:MAG: ABC transporter permease, partial [Nitrospirae bacterium]